jgi:hypothetical protein
MKQFHKLDGSYFKQKNLPKFLTAGEAAEALGKRGIRLSKDKMIELADQHAVPHYRTQLDMSQPLFLLNDLSDYIMYETMWQSTETKTNIYFLNVSERADVKPEIFQSIEKLMPCESLHIFPMVDAPVVYFLVSKGSIVYVGQSLQLGARIHQHKRDGEKIWDTVYYIPVPHDELSKVEQRLIEHLKPVYNIIYNN